jgi:hypothetical protein
MTSTITLNPAASTIATHEHVEITPSASNASAGLRRVAPAFIRADEAYYWSVPWQQDVRESMAALAAGDYEDFDSDDPNDVARWLLSVDEDDR